MNFFNYLKSIILDYFSDFYRTNLTLNIIFDKATVKNKIEEVRSLIFIQLNLIFFLNLDN